MKKELFLTVLIVILFGGVSCHAQATASKPVVTPKVNVYYFHFTRRCATCMAVEENARKALEALYPSELKTGEYAFTSLNLDEAGTKTIADKLGVGGQTMMVVNDEKKLDITSSVWMAAHNPVKMQEELKAGINKVLF